MAQPASTSAQPVQTVACEPCCSGPALAYLLLRVGLGLLLLLTGIEKFKSANPPYTYSMANWSHPDTGRWINVAKPVYEMGGFNNDALVGEKFSNFLSWVFYYYALALPYLMLVCGFFILIGLLNRFFMLLGGFIWLSLALGQATLPDNQYVQLLLTYFFFHAAALALLRYNRFCITRG